jgi:hypothetical protein
MYSKWLLISAMGASIAGLSMGCESDGDDPQMMGQIRGEDGRVYQDTDNDGRRDAMDAAPYNPRDDRRANDSDNDGVRDLQDRNDRKRNYRDTDKDGTVDSQDRHPRDPRAQ